MTCAGDSEIYFQLSFTLCFAHYAVSGNGNGVTDAVTVHESLFTFQKSTQNVADYRMRFYFTY